MTAKAATEFVLHAENVGPEVRARFGRRVPSEQFMEMVKNGGGPFLMYLKDDPNVNTIGEYVKTDKNERGSEDT